MTEQIALEPAKAPQAQAMAGYSVACKYGVYESRAFKLADDMYAAMFAAESAEVSALRASHAELRGCLASMMDWARELPDQYLDSDPEVRASFVEDLRAARAALAHAPE